MVSALFVLGGVIVTAAPIQIIGHRGARAMRPENTVPGFEYAIDVGANAVQMDVAVTGDDVLVISHEPVLDPEICRSLDGSSAIRELTFARLRQQWECGSIRNPHFPKQTPLPGTRIPALEEVFALANRGNFVFNIETKIFHKEQAQDTPTADRFAELLVRAIDRHNLRPRVVVQSFDFRILSAIRKLAPDIRIAALDQDDKLGDFVSVARSAGAQIIAPDRAMVTPSRVMAAHQAGLLVLSWIANTAPEWDALIAADVDGIMSDDPEALIAYMKTKKSH